MIAAPAANPDKREKDGLDGFQWDQLRMLGWQGGREAESITARDAGVGVLSHGGVN